MTSTTHTTGHATQAWRAFLRRGGFVLVVFIVLGVLGGLAAFKLAHKQYTGVARVLVSDTGVGTLTTIANGRTTGEVNLDTEAQLVTARGVLDTARQRDPDLRQFSLDDLTSQITVSVPANTAVLQIAYVGETPAAAQNGANALANAYLDNRRSAAQNELAAQISAATTTRADLLQTLHTLTAAQEQSQAPRPNYTSLQIGLTTGHIRAINAQLVALRNTQITPGEVVWTSTRPTSASSPSRILYLGSGFAVGLLLGLLAAWLRTRFRRTVRTADDLAHVVDVPCVADLTSADPSAIGTYRHLALVTTAVVTEPARIVVTSPRMSQVCTRVAAGMASSLVRTGTSTALLQIHGDQVDAPDPAPVVPVTRHEFSDDIVRPGDTSLSSALDRIRDGRSLLIVGVPDATVTADAQVLAAEADAVLIVVPSHARSRTVRDAVAGLDSVGAPILGTVLVPKAGRPTPTRRTRRAAPAATKAAPTSRETERTAPSPDGHLAGEPAARGDL